MEAVDSSWYNPVESTDFPQAYSHPAPDGNIYLTSASSVGHETHTFAFQPIMTYGPSINSFLFPQSPGSSFLTAPISSHDHYTTIQPDWTIQVASQGSTGAAEPPISQLCTPAYVDEMSKGIFDRTIDGIDTNETDMNTGQRLCTYLFSRRCLYS